MRRIDLVGKTFGDLLVLSLKGINKNKHTIWSCLCSCGKEKDILGINLRHNRTKSCGCKQAKNFIENAAFYGKQNITHGLSYSKTYKVWANIKKRCLDKKNKHYKNYGGRGITLCSVWKDSFETFYKDMGEAPLGLEIDRINNDGNYEPSNCRWVTKQENTNNRRCTKNK